MNIGNPDERTVMEIAKTVIEIAGSHSEIVFEPLPQDDPKQRKPNIAKAKETLGWQPKIKLVDGLKKTIAHFETVVAAQIAAMKPSGIILSGGPSSVYAKDAPMPDKAIFKLGVPMLGICYGVQLLAQFLGGRVEKGQKREYGKGTLTVADKKCALFRHLPNKLQVWNSHGDKLTRLPRDFVVVGTTDNSDYAAIEDTKRHFFGIQFHPEVAHTPRGGEILSNFLFEICGCTPDWTPGHFVETEVARIRELVAPEQRVICGLSGGVDSSVAAVLVLELLNTATEAVVDLTIGRQFHPLARIAKDCAAAAVLVAALSSLMIALLLLVPALWARLGL